MRITRTIAVDGTPPSAVYAYLSDFTTSEQWDPGTIETVLVEGDGGVGSVYHNRSVFRGRETELTYVTVDLQPDRLVVMRGENSTVVAEDTMSISPGGLSAWVTKSVRPGCRSRTTYIPCSAARSTRGRRVSTSISLE